MRINDLQWGLNELWGLNEAPAPLHPLFPLLSPPFHPNFSLGGGGRAAVAPAKSQIPPSTPSLHLFLLFWPHFSVAGQDGGPSPLRDPCSGGVPSSVGVPNPGGGSLCPQGSLTFGGPSPLGVPHPVVAGGALLSPRTGGRGTPSAPPPRFWGGVSPPPSTPTAPGFGGLPGLGGRRPPALTQPCSCSAPGRGRSPAAASLALVGGGIN